MLCDPGSDLLIVFERHVRRPAATRIRAAAAPCIRAAAAPCIRAAAAPCMHQSSCSGTHSLVGSERVTGRARAVRAEGAKMVSTNCR